MSKKKKQQPPQTLNKNELGLMRANHEDAILYDEEQGGPLALMHCVNDVPRLLDEIERLRDLLEIIHTGAFGRQYQDEWAKGVVELIHSKGGLPR